MNVSATVMTHCWVNWNLDKWNKQLSPRPPLIGYFYWRMVNTWKNIYCSLCMLVECFNAHKMIAQKFIRWHHTLMSIVCYFFCWFRGISISNRDENGVSISKSIAHFILRHMCGSAMLKNQLKSKRRWNWFRFYVRLLFLFILFQRSSDVYGPTII